MKPIVTLQRVATQKLPQCRIVRAGVQVIQLRLVGQCAGEAEVGGNVPALFEQVAVRVEVLGVADKACTAE